MSGIRQRVAIAISSFQSNCEALSLAERIAKENWPCEHILLVDSLGSGAFDTHIAANGLCTKILYFNSLTNLGSAGNLRKRFLWAHELGMDYVLALNHDAVITLAVFLTLLESADTLPNLGALYPLRRLEAKNIYDLTGQKLFSFGASGPQIKPKDEFIEMYWSSSNGALYSTAPFREDNRLCPDSSLWMGWEDYLYGLQLREKGYRQWVVSSAETVDRYEYKTVTFSPAGKTVADKPIWYEYYDSRNMLLIALYRLKSIRLTLLVLTRVFSSVVMAPFRSREQKFQALAYCLAGVLDGLRNTDGKWKLP
jgi:GT2 family glycosyltransferase